MSEGMEITADPEVEDLVYRMKAVGKRLEALVATTSHARAESYHVQRALADRLMALAKERPGVRWRVGDTIFWAEDARLCSEPADPR